MKKKENRFFLFCMFKGIEVKYLKGFGVVK